MSEKKFYINAHDRSVLLETLIDKCRTSIILNTTFSSPKPRVFNKLCTELLDGLSINPAVYLIGEYTTNPISTSVVGDGKFKGEFRIIQNAGGPLISMSLCMPVDDNGIQCLLPSSISHPDTFWNEAHDRLMPPPFLLLSSFKDIWKTLRGNFLHKVCGRIWMGSSALENFKSGNQSVLRHGKKIRFHELLEMKS